MNTGEVAQIARERGVPNVDQMNKEEMIQALTRQAGGQGKDPQPPGTRPQDWKNVPGNQS
jgi:hypothetical protein